MNYTQAWNAPAARMSCLTFLPYLLHALLTQAPAEPAANGNHAAAAPPEDPLEPTMPSQEFLMAAAMEAKEPSAQKRKAPGKGPKVVPSSGPRARPPVRKKGALRFVKEYQVYLAVAGFGVVAAAVAAYLVHTGNSYFG